MADAKELVRRLTDEVFIGGDTGVIDELVAEDFVDNDPVPGLSPDREGLRQLASMVGAFSDRKMSKDTYYQDGDIVVEDWLMTGRHTGDFLGVPPQGNEVTMRGIELWRVRDDKIIEHWGVVDMITAFSQMGGFPQL